jgi:hypothetical protein
VGYRRRGRWVIAATPVVLGMIRAACSVSPVGAGATEFSGGLLRRWERGGVRL